MSARDFTQGQQIPGEEAESGRRGSDVCGSWPGWMDGALTGTLTRLRDLRASLYTELNFFIPSAGLAAKRGNPAPARLRGSFSTDSDGDFTHHSSSATKPSTGSKRPPCS